MKKSFLIFIIPLMWSQSLFAQNITAKTNEIEVNSATQLNLQKPSLFPSINWIVPIAEHSIVHNGLFYIQAKVKCETKLNKVEIVVKSIETNQVLGKHVHEIQKNELNSLVIEKTIHLPDGKNQLEVMAENMDGLKVYSTKVITVGTESLAKIDKLDRTDYALVFATDNYDNWSDLVNPIFDSRAIANELRNIYNFKVEVVENATQSEILKKLREYAGKEYKPLDQLFIFFAGHGTFDQTFGEGFVVTKESLLNDEAKTTYLSHNRLRSITNNIPCNHILLTMDVCFGGTFDAAIASARGTVDEIYKEQNQNEFISRKLLYKTRRYLTSGGKEYVSDGVAGKHSPFTKFFLDALRSRGGQDNILTLPELNSYVEKLKTPPRFGEFGDNQAGSDFVFVVY